MAFLIERAQNEKEQLRVFFFFQITLKKIAKNGEVREQMRDSTHTNTQEEKSGGRGDTV